MGYKANILLPIILLWMCQPAEKQSAIEKTDKIINTFDKIVQKKPNSEDLKDNSSYIPNGWVEIKPNEDIHLDIRYATPNNFVKEKLYPCGKCFLRNDVASHLYKVIGEARSLGYDIILYDCYRPAPVQHRLWEIMPNPSYVTPPKRGSMHNKGAAVDIGFLNQNGEHLDFGSPYDFFGIEAHHDYASHSNEIQKRRSDLKQTMEKHGFKAIRTEWWHYSIPSYQKAQTSDWVWKCN